MGAIPVLEDRLVGQAQRAQGRELAIGQFLRCRPPLEEKLKPAAPLGKVAARDAGCGLGEEEAQVQRPAVLLRLAELLGDVPAGRQAPQHRVQGHHQLPLEAWLRRLLQNAGRTLRLPVEEHGEAVLEEGDHSLVQVIARVIMHLDADAHEHAHRRRLHGHEDRGEGLGAVRVTVRLLPGHRRRHAAAARDDHAPPLRVRRDGAFARKMGERSGPGAQVQDHVQRALLLDPVLQQSLVILQRLPRKHQPVSEIRHPELEGDLAPHFRDHVPRFHIDGDGFAGERFDPDLHAERHVHEAAKHGDQKNIPHGTNRE
mmetsp:Transcript_26024/g.78435  ORF Transcript_26024/g.78435 Transcript_26024/m.78435 type:complete len:314 (+) Transcript_26024:361-1302(+)